MPDLINRILKITKPRQKKEYLLKKCYKIYYGNKDYVLSSDISKISDRFLGILDRYRNLVYVDRFSSSINEEAFKKGLEIWKPMAYAGLDEPYIKYRIIGDNGLGQYPKYSRETLLKLSDILNDTYKKDLIKFKDNGLKGYKYSKVYECYMLVLNTIFDRIEQTQDYDKIISSNDHLFDFSSILKLPIDLNDIYTIYSIEDDNMIDLVIKKDYLKPFNIYAPNSKKLNSYVKVAKHLKDFKLTYTITKDTLKEFDQRPGYYQKDDNTLLTDIFSRFDFTSRKPKPQEITEGNLTVRFIG